MSLAGALAATATAKALAGSGLATAGDEVATSAGAMWLTGRAMEA